LDDDFHKILLCDDVLAVDDLLQYSWKYALLVYFQIDAVELGETDDVGADEVKRGPAMGRGAELRACLYTL
jgi:hypothetical protein